MVPLSSCKTDGNWLALRGPSRMERYQVADLRQPKTMILAGIIHTDLLSQPGLRLGYGCFQIGIVGHYHTQVIFVRERVKE